jgi:hypothetical protein
MLQAYAMACHHFDQQWAFTLQATGTHIATGTYTASLAAPPTDPITHQLCAQPKHSSAELAQHLEACVACLTAVALQQGC